MAISLDALQVIDSIDRRGSFAGAARELDRVPSAITYTVRGIEDDLDVLLFDRRGHRAALTPAGRQLLDEGRLLLRAAERLEAQVKRTASGWETEIRIAVDDVIGCAQLLPLVAEFHAIAPRTRLRLDREVLSGTCDALMSDRCDLAIGLSGDDPSGGGYQIRPLGHVEFLFAIAPAHALANAPEPITRERLRAHRVVAVADSARHLPVRSVGVLGGQDTLTVADFSTKLAAQIAGLGCGFLPEAVARRESAAGRLVIRAVEEEKPRGELRYAWRTAHRGMGLAWFTNRLVDPQLRASLLAGAMA